MLGLKWRNCHSASVSGAKLTSTRVLAFGPLYNGILCEGDCEITIVTRLWITSAILSIDVIASVKDR